MLGTEVPDKYKWLLTCGGLRMIVDFVTDRLAVGNAIDTPADVDHLKSLGVTHVINCRAEFDDRSIQNFASEMHNSAWCPTLDDGLYKPMSWFKPGVEFGLNVLSQPCNRLFVHCAGGINRGPSMTMAILRAWGIPKPQAVAMLMKAHPQANSLCPYWNNAEDALKELGYVK